MTYKIAVCDDSAADRDYITAMTRQWAQSAGHFLKLPQGNSAKRPEGLPAPRELVMASVWFVLMPL